MSCCEIVDRWDIRNKDQKVKIYRTGILVQVSLQSQISNRLKIVVVACMMASKIHLSIKIESIYCFLCKNVEKSVQLPH